MFGVFDGACKDLTIDTLTRFLTQCQPIWHQKEKPGKYQELEIDRAVMLQCWIGLSFFYAKLAQIKLEFWLRCLQKGFYMPLQKLLTLWGLSPRFDGGSNCERLIFIGRHKHIHPLWQIKHLITVKIIFYVIS